MSLGDISIIGLGKLGAPMAACMASKGFTVYGTDAIPSIVDAFSRVQSPVQEPGLGDLLTANKDRLIAASDIKHAVIESDVTFVVVPTPSDANGKFMLWHVQRAMAEIGDALAKKAQYHLVCLTSTVLPGSMDYGVVPVLEAASGKRCGVDFGVCYNPEFIALGTVIRDFLNPDLILIGESDAKAGALLAEYYVRLCDNTPSVSRMNFVSAELSKIAINTYVTTKITFANMLTELCEQLPGANIDVVTKALGADTRIGARYLKGGLGYGGPCFPRDNLALGYLARELGVDALLAESTDTANRRQVERIMDMLRRRLVEGSTVAVLGLAYKPGTVVLEESQGFELTKALVREGFQVQVYDPLALPAATAILGDQVVYAGSPQEALQGCDAVILANDDPAFKALTTDEVRKAGSQLVLDCWRTMPQLAGEAGIAYVPLGIGRADEDASSVLASLWTTVMVG